MLVYRLPIIWVSDEFNTPCFQIAEIETGKVKSKIVWSSVVFSLVHWHTGFLLFFF